MSHLWKEQVSKINGTLVKYSYEVMVKYSYELKYSYVLLLSTMTCFVSKIGVQALNACKNPHFNEVLFLSFQSFFSSFSRLS